MEAASKEKTSSADKASEHSARTKPESLVRDFDSGPYKGSSLLSPMSGELSPVRLSPRKKMSKFAAIRAK